MRGKKWNHRIVPPKIQEKKEKFSHKQGQCCIAELGLLNIITMSTYITRKFGKELSNSGVIEADTKILAFKYF